MEQLRPLIEALHLVAASAEAQTEHLVRIGLTGEHVDEIALEFDDALRPAAHLVHVGTLSPRTGVLIDQLDRAFERLSEEPDPTFWTAKALHHDARWHAIRSLATLCLDEMKAVSAETGSAKA